MTKLSWNGAGERLFEAGADRGVLYPPDPAPGVAWNGLIGLRQTPSGGEPKGHYMDGVKYLNRATPEEFDATLEAYTYPDEFMQFDGFIEHTNSGFFLGQQLRRTFGLSYRTMIGNDLQGIELGYRIHLIYNALATPSEKAYNSIAGDLEPIAFSWGISTQPIPVPGFRPTAYVTIDSRKVDPFDLRAIEDYLYGTENTPPRLLDPSQWINYLDASAFEMTPNFDSGVWPLNQSAIADVKKTDVDGIYDIPEGSRLTEVSPGLYTLEP